MAMQGARASQGWVNKNCLDWLTIRPQDAAGGCAPMPKKLSELSDRMAEGTFRVNRTINEGMQLGRICLSMILPLLTPIERAASTYSLSFRLRVWLRTTRATLAQLVRESAINRLTVDWPRVYITTMASSRDGMDSIISARRMMT